MNELFNRIIPCLLFADGGLVKTRRFAKPRYVGDPINAIRIFNEKSVDELVLLDIEASRLGREPDYDLIARIAGECFMPLCYGGGIRTLAQARRIIASGVEKIAVNSAAIEQPGLLTELAAEFGASSVVAAIDVSRGWRGERRVYHPGQRRRTAMDPVAHARAAVAAGAGEIFLNSVDRDGTCSGYDLDLVRQVAAAVSVPLIVCGGAGTLEHMRDAVSAGALAAAAGSLFVFYGPHRAVLINYPDSATVEQLFAR